MRCNFAICVLISLGCLAQDAPPLAVEEAVAPTYPPLAILGRAAGSVLVDVRVSAGAVSNASVSEGDPLLRQASLDAARLWRFRTQSEARNLKLIFSFRLMPKGTPEPELGAIFRPPYAVEVRKITPEPVHHFARSGSDPARQASR